MPNLVNGQTNRANIVRSPRHEEHLMSGSRPRDSNTKKRTGCASPGSPNFSGSARA